MNSPFKILLVILCSKGLLPGVSCVEFNRDSTGVIFLPYVLNTAEYTIYSIDEIKTMLKVVSTKFSRVATVETSKSATHKENVTYEHTYSEVRTAEAAALLNREALSENTNQFMSVYVGITLRLVPERMHSEIRLAFESIHKSIEIHPGTVHGIILSEWKLDFSENVTIANHAILEAQNIKKQAHALNLTFGIKTFCENYDTIINTADDLLDSLAKARKQLLLHFDFIICMRYAEDYFPLGINKTIELITENVLTLRSFIQIYNPRIVFMVETCISEYGTTKKHYQYQLDFWTRMDQWGTDNNIPIWFHSAFDNPWQIEQYGEHAKYGWWKINNDTSLILTDVNAYEEKVEKLLEPDASLKPLEEETNLWKYIGGMSGFAVFMLALALLGVCWIRKNYVHKSVLTRKEINDFLNGPLNSYTNNLENGNIETEALSKPYDKSIEIRKDSIQISWLTTLGSGEFGVVYKAIIKGTSTNDHDTVALKMTKDCCPKTAVMSILSEIKILSYLGAHENIVSMKGAYTAEIEKGVVYVATELCELGSLQSYLRKASNCGNENTQESQSLVLSVEFNDMIKWSYEIACGMEYLAEKNVIHADLATRNVLLTGNKTAKITDFGLSRRLYDYTNYVKKQQEPLPWRWMAIEALKRLEFSSQSDVWSYGVTLWEIFSMGDVPYPGLSWTLDFVDSLEYGLRMKCPVLASPEIYAMMSSCWILEPRNRPTFAQLKQSFARMVKIIN